jgi:hypothetical protein
MRTHVRTAYEQELPISAIIVDGPQRNPNDAHPVASKVKARLLDSEPWAVKEYNFETGEWLLVRGKKPFTPAFIPPNIELSFFEGTQRTKFILHRRREGEMRRAKIAEALTKDGKLVCEVPSCKFDFKERYGPLGEGYAQVHGHCVRKLPRDDSSEWRLPAARRAYLTCSSCRKTCPNCLPSTRTPLPSPGARANVGNSSSTISRRISPTIRKPWRPSQCRRSIIFGIRDRPREIVGVKEVIDEAKWAGCDGSDGRPRSWYIDVGEDWLGNEIAFLKTEMYLSEVEPRLQTLTALSRFSVRA